MVHEKVHDPYVVTYHVPSRDQITLYEGGRSWGEVLLLFVFYSLYTIRLSILSYYSITVRLIEIIILSLAKRLLHCTLTV